MHVLLYILFKTHLSCLYSQKLGDWVYMFSYHSIPSTFILWKSLCRFVLFLPEMFGSTNSSVESSRPHVLFSGRCLHIDLTDIRLFKCISFLWLR